ncbi:hypothetical protein BH23PLA1_BH23PLA1_12800 [soil metagenome]
MNWEDTIVDAAATDTGMRRTNNQDSYAIVRAKTQEVWKRRGHVFIVADGMGAHAVGEMASKLACDNIPHNYLKSRSGLPVEAITKTYRDVGGQIHAKASANRDFQGMGTTASTLIFQPEGALIAHVGDSRVYRIRNGQLDQLTFDHSLVWELIRRNHLKTDAALKSVPRNVITRSLGPDPTVEVDIEGPLPVEPGDVYLLCTDGLSGPVQDPELGAIANNFHPDETCRYLLNLANLRGGHDNITLIVARVGPWIDPDQPASEAVDSGPAKRKGGKGFSFAKLIGVLQRKPPPEPIEEHLYRSADCAINDDLLDRLSEQVRETQAIAVDQAWPVDWPELTVSRRKADEARAAGERRRALKNLGESIVRLGVAGRLHRKEHGPIGAR